MTKRLSASQWLSLLDRARKDDGISEYDERCREIRRRYRYADMAKAKARRYQLLWSTIETMQSAIYAKPPKASVSRRYRDPDPTSLVATEILERAINFSFDASNFDDAFLSVRDDFLLYGRGTARIYYEPEYETEDDEIEDISNADDIAQGNGLGARGAGDPRPGTVGPYTNLGGTPRSVPGNPRPTKANARADQSLDSDGDSELGDDGDGEQGKRAEKSIKFENVRIRFVQRADFRHQPARTWGEVEWVGFRAFMTRPELTQRFGKKIGSQIPLDADTEVDDDSDYGGSGRRDRAKATIWEIWDKARDEVLWVAKGWPDVLERGEPYLDLDGFYPCPRPAYGTLTPDSLVPVPDYVFYQDQGEEIDQLTARIGALSDALKFVGFYPAGPQGEGAPEIELAMSSGFENKMIAVKAWDVFTSGGKGPPVVFLPIENVVSIIEACIKLRQQLVEDVYQIIGISDIMRGATDPQETEGAQQLKAQYGGTRIRDRQNEIVRFCRDVARLTGDVISTYCQPATIQKMTGINLPTAQDAMMASLAFQQKAQQAAMMANVAQLHPGIGPQQPNGMAAQPAQTPLNGQPPPSQPPQPPNLGPTQEDVFAILRDPLSRRFKIDIENDSTIAGDESQERQDRSQFIEAMTKFMEAWGPMVIQKPELSPLAGQLLLFGVRSFRVGRELEEVIEQTAQKLASAPPTQPGQDGKAAAEQVKLKGTMVKTQAEIQKSQIDAGTAQQAGQLKMQEIQTASAAKIAELKMKLAAAEQEHGHRQAEAGLAHSAAMDKMALSVQKQQADAQAAKQKQAQEPKWPVDPGKDQGF